MPVFANVEVTLKPKGGIAPAQNVFTTLKYTDRNGIVHTLLSSAADYAVNADNSATWSWDVGVATNLPNQAQGASTPLVMS
jgi:hypothetical protein